jgi:hypothetical protein
MPVYDGRYEIYGLLVVVAVVLCVGVLIGWLL